MTSMGQLKRYGRNFWQQATERALKTSAQAFVLVLGGDGANLLHLNPKTVIGSLAGGFVLSIVTSIATAGVGPADDPSMVPPTDDAPAVDGATPTGP